MKLNDPRDNVAHPLQRFNGTERKLTQSQGDLMSEALRRAAIDVHNAVSHRLSEPLTALLLYLREIKKMVEHSTGSGEVLTSVRRMSDMALLEAERIHQMVTPEAKTCSGWPRHGIDVLAPNRDVDSNIRLLQPSHLGIRQPLTPREHAVLTLIAGSESNSEGGADSGISKRGCEVHRVYVMRDLGTRNAAGRMRLALSNPTVPDSICIGPTEVNNARSACLPVSSGLSA
jgi:hypothetical protein